GLDGRKMSKSYNNTIPLFLPEKQLRKSIMKIVTDSTEPGVPKDPDQSTLYEMYKAFATEAECAEIRKAYAEGIAWGEMKQVLFEKINAILIEPREKYNELMANPEYVESILLKGAEKAREHTVPFIAQLKKAVGL
ncbi:MAG: tryptophan--tRNA ligase, partial [Wohlfahrtiimonas sp.]